MKVHISLVQRNLSRDTSVVLVGKAAVCQGCTVFSSEGLEMAYNGVFMLFWHDLGAGWALVEKCAFLLKCLNAEMKAVTKQNISRAKGGRFSFPFLREKRKEISHREPGLRMDTAIGNG